MGEDPSNEMLSEAGDLGCIRKQAKQDRKTKPASSPLPWFCFSSCLKVPDLTSLNEWTVT